MVDAYLRQSALAHLHLGAIPPQIKGVSKATLCEQPIPGLFIVRGNSGDTAFMAAIKKATKVSLPLTPNTTSGSIKGTHALWMGPDEWLIVAKQGTGSKTLKALITATKNLHASITEISESKTIISLSGPQAKTILSKGCSLDLHSKMFGPEQCAQTILARANIILHQTAATKAETHSYRLYVQRSFAEYLWRWLVDAGGEYSLILKSV